jgi:predicted amidohydrolase YtcJ
MSTPQLLRWGVGLSAAVVALAVVLRLQQPLQNADPDSQTFCYQGVRTHDEARPSARCFTVSSGVFTDVSTRDDLAAATVPGYAIPGLWDGHGHLLPYGEFLHSVDLFGSSSFGDVRTRLVDYVKVNPNVGTRKEWLRGIGWDQTAFGRMPTAVSVILLLNNSADRNRRI